MFCCFLFKEKDRKIKQNNFEAKQKRISPVISWRHRGENKVSEESEMNGRKTDGEKKEVTKGVERKKGFKRRKKQNPRQMKFQ